MIKGIEDRASRQDVIGKIKTGAAVLKIPKQETFVKKDSVDNDITYTKYKDKDCEILGEKGNDFYIKVNKDDERRAFPMSTGYFFLPPELEDIYGKRATEIDIVFHSNNLDDIIPNSYTRFLGGGLFCKGDGEKARRVNTEGVFEDFKPCLCAYSKYFPEELLTEVDTTTLKESEKRKISKDGTDTFQALVQGAWREITNGKDLTEKKTTIAKLETEKFERSCDARYHLTFLCHKIEGINLYCFDGGGLANLKRLLDDISKAKVMFNRIQGIPLKLRVAMEKQKSIQHGTRKFPKVYLHVPYNLGELMTSRFEDQLKLPAGKDIDFETGEEVEIEN